MHQLIRASAGSGKTYQLTGHFLRQLFAGTPPETILATTFTRKAAGEILGRVLTRLAEAAVNPSAASELVKAMEPHDVTPQSARDLLHELTRNLHRLRISTLDSFFQQVARSLTLELGLPPGWSIVDEHADSELRERAIDGVLSRQSTHASQELMQMLARGRSRRSVRSLIDETVTDYYRLFLLTSADAWNRIPPAKTLTRDRLQQSVDELDRLTVDDKRMNSARLSDVERARREQWKEFLGTGLAKKIGQNETTYYRKQIPDNLIAIYQRLLTHAHATLLKQIADRNEAARSLVERFDIAYRQLRNETGFTRFEDITRLLARSDGAVEGSRMNYRLDSSIRHLLLDEFQDTSLDQWHVLRRLVRDIAGGDEVGSIFCVGDPKQAIYGWRGGVAEILDEVEHSVPGIRTETLDLSRRSSPAVIETVNLVFQQLARHTKMEEYDPACRTWSDTFPEHSTHHSALPGFAELRTSPNFDGPTAEATPLYYEWVATQIRQLHEQAPGVEIGVLLRKNDTVARLVHELTKMGVAASEEGGTPPTDSAAVLAVMSLLHLSSHPGCTVSRYHVVHSPLAGLVELTDWTDDEAAAATAAELRSRLMDDGYGRTLQWIAEAIEPQCGDRDLLRMKQVVGEGWRFDRSPSLNPSEFVQLLEDKSFRKSTAAPVRVMTIHQSKGLEFDIVVAPELDGTLIRVPAAAAGGPDRVSAPENVCTWTDRNLRHILPPSLQDAFVQTTDEKVRGALCLLYVTLTRAVHSLHLYCHGGVKSSSKSFAGILAATLCDTDVLDENSRAWSTGDEFWFNSVPKTQSDGATTRNPARPELPRLQLAAMPDGRRRGLIREAPSHHERSRLNLVTAPAATASPDAPDGRTRGTLIHAWFDIIRWLDEDELPEPDQLREIAQELRVRELRIPEAAIDGLLLEFFRNIDQPATRNALSRKTVHRTMARQLGLPASSRLNLRVETERPFVFRRQSAIVQGTIDRLVIAEHNGQPVAAEIIDFKTDRLTGDPVDWVAMKHADYAEQLRDYREAVVRCFDIPAADITSSLLLLEADACVVVD